MTFEGANDDELEKAFHEAVDDYLALCEKIGKKPERSYSGNIPLRINESLHRRVAVAADAEGKSVNSWIADALDSISGTRGVLTGKPVGAVTPYAPRARRSGEPEVPVRRARAKKAAKPAQRGTRK